MNLEIDVESFVLSLGQQPPALCATLTGTVTFMRKRVPFRFPAGTGILIGVNSWQNPTTTILASAIPVRPAADGSPYTYSLSLDTAELKAKFTAGITSYDASIEVEWEKSVGSGTYDKTRRKKLTVDATAILSDSVTPVPLAAQNDFFVSSGTALTVDINGGKLGGSEIAAQPGVVITNATNYIELDGSGVAVVNTSGWTSNYYPLALVVASGGVITSNSDRRAWLNGGSGGITSIATGKMLWVDSVNGNDTNAGTFNASFLTLAAAKAAAVSGTTIFVRPGSYAVTDSILKNGVNWHFEAGATVTMTQNASAVGILDDKGASVTCNVTGQGTFVLTSSATGLANFGVVNVTHASSVVNIEALDITLTHSGSPALAMEAVNVAGGQLTLKARNISATGADIVYAIWWSNGKLRGQAQYVYGKSSAFYSDVNTTATGDAEFTAEEWANGDSTEGVVYGHGTDTSGAVWLSGKIFRSTSTICIETNSGSGNKIYVTAQKLFGRIKAGGGKLYVLGHPKMEATANDTALFVDAPLGGNASAFLYLGELDAAGFTGTPFSVTGGSATIRIFGAQFVGNSGTTTIPSTGIGSTATLLLSGCNLNLSAATIDGITASKGTVNIENCRITTNAANKDIAQSSTATVNVSGGWGTGSNGNFTTSGTVNFEWPSATFPGDISGNAATVTTIGSLTGDVTSSNRATTLATVNSNVGSFGSATESTIWTVNAKGLVTAAANVTITPAITNVSGLGTSVATALQVAVGSAGAFVVNGGALGTPSSGVATNLTGTASGLTAGAATVLANARTIGGVSFNGSANITVASATGGFAVSGGNLTVSGDLTSTDGDFSSSVGTASVRFLRLWTDGVGFRDKVMRYWAPAGVSTGIGVDSTNFYVNGTLYISDGGGNVNVRLMCPTVDGLLVLSNNASTAFTRLAFGVNTSSGAAFAISTTTITACLGDGSAGGVFATSGGRKVSVSVKTTTYSMLATDDVVVGNHATVAFTISLLAVSGNTGVRQTIKNKGAAAVTVDVTGGGSNIFTSSAVASVTLNAGDSITVVNDGAIWNVI